MCNFVINKTISKAYYNINTYNITQKKDNKSIRNTSNKSHVKFKRINKIHCNGLNNNFEVDVTSKYKGSNPKDITEADVIIIGSGIGGLCCAALLAKYGINVVVVESHYTPGGAAHGWTAKTKSGEVYHFESGPSLYSGMRSRGISANPLSHVFQAIGEDLDYVKYDSWNIYFPEGTWKSKVGSGEFLKILEEVKGKNSDAVSQWLKLEKHLKGYTNALEAFPPCALRWDPAEILIILGKYLKSLLKAGPNTYLLTAPFSEMVKDIISDEFIVNYLDLLSFLLSGLPMNGTIAAEMVFMFNEWYKEDCFLEFPRGGSQAMVDALIKSMIDNGGKLLLKSHVNEILIENNKACGILLKNGHKIKARKAIVSNASIWDTVNIIDKNKVPFELKNRFDTFPLNKSFMHLHLGFDATGLDDLDLHHIIVNDWKNGVDAEQNVVLVSIPSVMDPSFAPSGKHSLHAYMPATEPYDLWHGLDRNSEKYKKLKEERSELMWTSIEKFIPDIRKRCEISLVGTPLTHSRFLRRYKGTYGPAIKAGIQTFPGSNTPINGLYCCGDSVAPGIGLPAVAASGFITANTLVPVWDHWKMLDSLGI